MTFRAQSVRSERAVGRLRSSAAVRAMVQRFDAGRRPRIATLAASHVFIEDLMWTFPAMIYALALDFTDERTVEAACTLVRHGAPLRTIADRLALPMWLRRLPPEAFTERLENIPGSSSFSRQIGNLLPKTVKDSSRWLKFVTMAAIACDEPFAIWTARNFARFAPDAQPEDLVGLALFSWFSARPELEAGNYVENKWHNNLEPAQAARVATAWLERLDFPIFRAPFIAIEGVCNYMDGFKFVALRTATEICSDARALDNCLRGYAQVTAEGSDQLWSIRRNGRSVAALHITFSCEGEGLPEIDQIRGYKNSRVTSATLHAVYRWLLTWPGQCRTINADWRRCNVHPATYRKLMKPFWWEKGLVTWLPLAPNDTCFEEVRQGLWNVCDPRRRRRMRLRRARR